MYPFRIKDETCTYGQTNQNGDHPEANQNGDHSAVHESTHYSKVNQNFTICSQDSIISVWIYSNYVTIYNQISLQEFEDVKNPVKVHKVQQIIHVSV